MPSMSTESYKTLIDLQADLKSFETSVDKHFLKIRNLRLEIMEDDKIYQAGSNEIPEEFYLQEKILDLKKENQDLMDMITTLERKVLDFYITHDVPGIKTDAESQRTNINTLKDKLAVKQNEFDKFIEKYHALEQNIQIDEKKHTMYYIIFIFWVVLLCVFLYICFKIYISNQVPSITFYIFFVAGIVSIYYIYVNLKSYFDI
jgi:hypothetical protein